MLKETQLPSKRAKKKKKTKLHMTNSAFKSPTNQPNMNQSRERKLQQVDSEGFVKHKSLETKRT